MYRQSAIFEGLEQQVWAHSIRDEEAGLSVLRRSHIEIVMDILNAIDNGAEKPTQIMYKANLSWISLKKYLDDLLRAGLINVADYGSRKRYEITEKARSLIFSYKSMLREMGSLRH